MVFSSVPVYLDPSNWHQQTNHIQQGTGSANHQLPPLAPPPHHAGPAASSIRPGSMADRARLAKIPQPEAALKCPRCDSTNTKFCYFNNYSLTQPRHFCKTCRRYWTRGGALRNVPVGGGCRRNKKSKSSSSKSPASAEKQAAASNSAAAVNMSPEMTGHMPQQTPHIPFMTSLQNFSQYGLGNLGLNFGGIQGQTGGQAEMGFQLGTNSGMSSAIHQQFPFFESAATNNGLYQFQSEGIESPSSMVGESQLLRSMSSSSRVSQIAPVKMETSNQQGLNLSRQLLGVSQNNQYWGGNSWTENLSGLNSSTTNHLL